MTEEPARSRTSPRRSPHGATASPAAQETATATAPCDIVEEVRFAVVMYGGVSLAIYINGIAQELLNMVYATAPGSANQAGPAPPLLSNEQLTGSRAVYRKLGQFLHEWNDATVQRESANAAEDPLAKVATKLIDSLGANDPVRTRFVVDVLSGTSAGGINAIFLAKALANQQNLDGLKDLWVREGDLAKLINDKLSVEGTGGLPLIEPQASLLNSQRMYRKLLDALDQMDPAGRPQEGASPLADEIDLFVTTTDIEGLPLPIKLSDSIVYEKRHKNVFHFRCFRHAEAQVAPEQVNDFVKENDPFLAFAARCTSSFPFAFEPMRLSDIHAVTSRYDKGRDHPYCRARADNPKWQKFYSEYWRPSLVDLTAMQRHGTLEGMDEANVQREQQQLKGQFLDRAFGDGGYLDNKPFSYATSLLMRRNADVPVHRKLVYIEPSPEHPEKEPAKLERPDFAENIRAALLDLPGKETIREDIERVIRRNRLLARVSAYSREVDADVARLYGSAGRRKTARGSKVAGSADASCDQRSVRILAHGEFGKLTLAETIRLRGMAYGAYHRLRVDEVSGALAVLVSRAAGHDSESDACVAIRALVDAWREQYYAADPSQKDKAPDGRPMATENAFLSEFDLHYRLRRCAFVSRRINELSVLDANSLRLLRTWVGCPRSMGCSTLDVDKGAADPVWREAFREELRSLKRTLSREMMEIRAGEENLAGAGEEGGSRFVDRVNALDVRWEELEGILDQPPAQRVPTAKAVLAKGGGTRERAMRELRESMRCHLKTLRRRPLPLDGGDMADGAVAARESVGFYYDQFPLYDMVLFPIQYGTGSTEANQIDIFRISPEDATALIDERRDCRGRRKLAGTVLMNFGAFLETAWRRNDILWGRLDGAERLISALMPGDGTKANQVRSQLIREAQQAILAEELHFEEISALRDLLVKWLQRHAPLLGDVKKQLAALEKSLRAEENAPDRIELSNATRTVLEACLRDRDALWEFYRDHYEVDRRVEPEGAVRSIARATHVTGRMLEGLARNYRCNDKPFGWLATLGTILWGMVEIAVPRSIWNLLWRHWIKVLYVLDLGFILGGLVFGGDDVARFGWVALAATFGVHMAVNALGDFISCGSMRRWSRFLMPILAIIIGALFSGGVAYYSKKWNLAFDQRTQGVVFCAVAMIVLIWIWISQLAAVWHRNKQERDRKRREEECLGQRDAAAGNAPVGPTPPVETPAAPGS